MTDGSDIRQASVSSQASGKQPKSITVSRSALLTVVTVIVVGGLAFWGGTAYGRSTATKPASSSRNGEFFERGGFGGGGFGTVSSISSTSITVKNSRTGATKTYAITSSTQITDNGSSTTASSITTGETVIVIPSSSNTSDAARILVNPSFHGGGGFGGQSFGSGTSTTTGL